MQAHTVHHVSLVVNDLEQALRFYRDVLGLWEVPRPPDIANPGAWLQLGDKPLHLIVAEGPHAASQQHVAIEMDDLEEVTRRLKAAGSHIVREPGQRGDGSGYMFVRDLSNNTLELVSH